MTQKCAAFTKVKSKFVIHMEPMEAKQCEMEFMKSLVLIIRLSFKCSFHFRTFLIQFVDAFAQGTKSKGRTLLIVYV